MYALPIVKKLILVLAFLSSWSHSALAEQFNVLLITKTVGWHHPAIHEGVAGMRHLAKKHFFQLTWEENVDRVITDASLSKYDALVFLLTTGDILSDEQQAVVERFIRSGKGFVGVHSAADTEYEWEWYTRLVGHMFHIHPVIQTAHLRVLDGKFPGLERMPKRLWWTDEWYEYGPAKTKGLEYLLAVDERSYDPKVEWKAQKKSWKGMGGFHPIAWYHPFDGGRAFYTGLGHMPSSYSDPLFLAHLYGGLHWAATGKGQPR